MPDTLPSAVLWHKRDSTPEVMPPYNRSKNTQWGLICKRLFNKLYSVVRSVLNTAAEPLQMGIQHTGAAPPEDWQIDFTQMPRASEKLRALLVFAHTFPGWAEASPA